MVKFIYKAFEIVLSRGSNSVVWGCALTLSLCAYLMFTYAPLPEFDFYSNSHQPDYHPDEGVWTASGKYYFEKFFLEKDWSYESWSTKRFGNFGDRNPVLVKYMIGSSLFINGEVRQGEDIPGFDFDRLDWPKIEQLRPPEPMLEAARKPIKAMAISAIVLFFLFIRSITGSWLIGSVSALVLSAQPHVISFSQKVMNDIPALCFSLLALLTSYLLLRSIWQKPLKEVVINMALIGVVIGLALQTKLSVLLTVITIACWALFELIQVFRIRGRSLVNWKQQIISIIRQHAIYKKLICGITVFGLVVGLLWVLPNPLLYQNTLKNTYFILRLSKKVEANPSALMEQKNVDFLKSWNSLIANGPERSGLFSYYFDFPSSVDKATILLGIIALVVLYAWSTGVARRGFYFIGVWMLVTASGILLWTPFDWPRWYIPMSPVWAVLQAMGLITLVLLPIQLAKQFSKPSVEGLGSKL